MSGKFTSGPIEEHFISDEDIRSSYEEVPCDGFNCLFKVKRQGRWFMLKGLKEEYRNDHVYLELLKKEYALMVEMDHPSIIKAYSKEVNEKIGPCIVMEYIDGMTLETFLSMNPSRGVLRRVADQIAGALAYIHSKQILHRDLKPSNILITHNGNNVKIIDFGYSDADGYAILKQSAGTLEYVSPERLNGAKADLRSDIYSFGLILREMIPHRYRRISAKCTRIDPSSRYESMDEVRRAIHNSDVRRQILPVICMAIISVMAVLFSFMGKSDRPVARQREGNVTADQKTYLGEAVWFYNSSVQELISEIESRKEYKEVMMARLTDINRSFSVKSSRMSKLYSAGSPEQMYFLSELSRKQEELYSYVLNIIDQKCPSYKNEYSKGRISSRQSDSLGWIISPTVMTGTVTSITDTSASVGVQLPDGSYARGAEIGICWDPCHNPTTDSHSKIVDISSDGGSVIIDGLFPNSTYFARAFIRTAAGTTYGNEVSFITSEGVRRIPEGAANGLFSVKDGQQVFFSKGNLRYRASTNTWRFAERTFDFVGKDNEKISQSYDGWIDLFGWGTSGYDHGARNYEPWSGNEDTQSSGLHYAYGMPDSHLFDHDGKADWGYNRIENGGDEENLWRTINLDQWLYLLFSRETSSGVRFAKGIVANVNGLILLPDNWEIAIYPLNSVNKQDADYSSNIISEEDWYRYLDNAGAVFLPEAGARTIRGFFAHIGAYYTSEAASTDAYHLLMNNQVLYLDSDGHRGDGLAVRLVRNYEVQNGKNR